MHALHVRFYLLVHFFAVLVKTRTSNNQNQRLGTNVDLNAVQTSFIFE